MKKIYTFLLLTTVLFAACKKDDEKKATGTLTAKIDLYDTATKKWSGGQDFIAKEVTTTKTGNDYTINTSDATGASFFGLTIKNVTGAGKYTIAEAVLSKGGVRYVATAGQVTVTEATAKTLKATFIFESTNMAVYDGKVDASF